MRQHLDRLCFFTFELLPTVLCGVSVLVLNENCLDYLRHGLFLNEFILLLYVFGIYDAHQSQLAHSESEPIYVQGSREQASERQGDERQESRSQHSYFMYLAMGAISGLATALFLMVGEITIDSELMQAAVTGKMK